MADGKTHTKVTLISGSVFSITLAMMGFYHTPILFSGFVYQVLASCDLDLDTGNISLYYLRKYTFVLQHYWRWVWYPYAKCMKHRGKSHATYGTIIRFIYLLSPFIILIPRFHDDPPDKTIVYYCFAAQLLCIPIQILIGFFIANYGFGALCLFVSGCVVGDLLHLAWDKYWYKHI